MTTLHAEFPNTILRLFFYDPRLTQRPIYKMNISIVIIVTSNGLRSIIVARA